MTLLHFSSLWRTPVFAAVYYTGSFHWVLLLVSLVLVPLLACGGEDSLISLYLWRDEEVSLRMYCAYCVYCMQ